MGLGTGTELEFLLELIHLLSKLGRDLWFPLEELVLLVLPELNLLLILILALHLLKFLELLEGFGLLDGGLPF